MHQTILQLVVAYTLVGVFVFTAIATALSLVGFIKFANPKQQKTLFATLIVELVAGLVAFFLGWIRLNPSIASTEIARDELRTKRSMFEKTLAAAKEELAKSNFSGAYELVATLFRSPELSEFLPIRDLFVVNGDIATKRTFWTEAVESYGPALRLDPNNVDLLVKTGFAYRNLEKYEEAERLYIRALAVKGQDWGVLNGYFNCLRRYAAFLADKYPKIADEKFQAAAEIAKQMKTVARSETEIEMAEVANAQLFWEWKKYDVATAQYEQLVKKYPTKQRFKEDLAAVYVESNRFGEAYGEFRKLADDELARGDVSHYVGSGLAEAAAKANIDSVELEKALKLGLQAISKKPNDPFAYYAVSLAQYKLNRKAEAENHLRQAIKLEDQRSTSIHTYDAKRHQQYLNLLANWTGVSAKKTRIDK